MVEIFLTSYNAEEKQTDKSPCVGAIGEICKPFYEGVRPLALSMDLIYGKKDPDYCKQNCFARYGDKLKLVSSEPQCNFEGVLMDTMDRFKIMRGDIFFPERGQNTSCTAKVYNLTR